MEQDMTKERQSAVSRLEEDLMSFGTAMEQADQRVVDVSNNLYACIRQEAEQANYRLIIGDEVIGNAWRKGKEDSLISRLEIYFKVAKIGLDLVYGSLRSEAAHASEVASQLEGDLSYRFKDKRREMLLCANKIKISTADYVLALERFNDYIKDTKINPDEVMGFAGSIIENTEERDVVKILNDAVIYHKIAVFSGASYHSAISVLGSNLRKGTGDAGSNESMAVFHTSICHILTGRYRQLTPVQDLT